LGSGVRKELSLLVLFGRLFPVGFEVAVALSGGGENDSLQGIPRAVMARGVFTTRAIIEVRTT
jgi:hypothetical protein